MKKKEKHFDARQRPFIAFLGLVIAILSGLLLWQSQEFEEAELQKQQTAEAACLSYGLTGDFVDNCIQSSLTLRALVESGVSLEDIAATEMSAPRATQVSQRSATEISQKQARATEISQNPHRATQTTQASATEWSQWSATEISQRRQTLNRSKSAVIR